MSILFTCGHFVSYFLQLFWLWSQILAYKNTICYVRLSHLFSWASYVLCPLVIVALKSTYQKNVVLKSDMGFLHKRSEWMSFCLVRVYCCYCVTESVVGYKGVVCWSMKDVFVLALGAGHLMERELHFVVAS